MKKDTTEPYALTGDELLVAVFSKFEKGKKFKLLSTFSLIFYQASKNPAYAQLFTNYPFNTDGPTVYSGYIEGGITDLRLGELLWQDGTTFYLTGGIDIRWREFIRKKLSNEQILLTRKLSEEIQKLLVE